MAVVLGQNNYGKSRVRLVQVTRHKDRHDMKELDVAIQVQGDFTAAHTKGDNAKVLPTDTMKNTVYALAQGDPVVDPEAFALKLSAHFLDTQAHISEARVEVREHLWKRIAVNGKPHRHSFLSTGDERRVGIATRSRASVAVEGGIDGLLVLKTTGSAFAGYIKDRYTTLPETDDRIFSTVVASRWRYAIPDSDFGVLWREIRRITLETFAEHNSQSVQQTVYLTGKLVLDTFDAISEIRFSLPNKHCLLVNLAPLGLENHNEIFVPTDEPYGLIEATIKRT